VTGVPVPVQHGIQKLLGTSCVLLTFSALGGGCINPGGKLVTSSGTFFLKWNDTISFPKMLALEVMGLTLLQDARSIRIPEVVVHGEENDFQFLLLEFIEPGRRSSAYWKNFGRQLALLHAHSTGLFGLNHNNYIGSLPQSNSPVASWTDFFIRERLKPQLELAGRRSLLPAPVYQKFEKLFTKLSSLLPDERPSLLHGDLWSGNVITSPEGEPCLIDPAVYYGHREMDLAMTELFGGFDSDYLEAYHEVLPLTPGYKQRVDLYNLYPLLVHVNLFGQAYVSQVLSILKRFVS